MKITTTYPKTKLASIIVGASLFAAVGTAVAVEDTDLPLGKSFKGEAPAGDAPWVNVLLRDFSDAQPGAYGDFEWIRNTVEVQVTTGSEFYDDAGGSCCGVQGKGNLTGSESLRSLYLNVNPRLNPKKLKIYWTGEPMPPGPDGANTFPAAGLKPTQIQIGRNEFQADGAGSFDILIQWKGKEKLGPDVDWSKLLIVYDDGNKDISADDFLMVSHRPERHGGPFIGVGRVKGIDGDDSAWIKQQ
jgi:hypothetical protein